MVLTWKGLRNAFESGADAMPLTGLTEIKGEEMESGMGHEEKQSDS